VKNRLYLFILLIGLFQASSCKKDAQPAQQQGQKPPAPTTLENGLVSFSIDGELLDAAIDTTANTITVVMPDSVNLKRLSATLTLGKQVSAALNSTAVNSTIVFDFTSPVVLTVTSADKKRSTSFQVIIQTELQYFGLAGSILGGKSLNKSYSFYFDQFDGSTFQAINCGPTVTTMAIKWANPDFNKKPVDARNVLESKGGWWYTSDIQQYLDENDINYAIDSLNELTTVVKNSIDHNHLVILCLDMYYVPQDMVPYQHIQKFYEANTTGWGHFLLVKGYKQTDNSFYLEIYDPYSDKQAYAGIDNGQLKGKDRYYLSTDIAIATNNWWPYAIIVAQKGEKVSGPEHPRDERAAKQKPIPVASGR